MPTIKTIKPAGGGDFTSLAAWEDWADDQLTADQWAECYSGGDLGSGYLGDWAAAGSASLFPRIYVADGHEHGGVVGAGAFTAGGITANVNYSEVIGLRVVSSQLMNGFDCANFKADRIVCHGGGNLRPLLFLVGTQTWQNCLLIGAASPGIDSLPITSGAVLNLLNCTVVDSDGHNFYTPSSSGVTVRCENCIGIGATGVSKDFALSGSGTNIANNNISGDATADDYGGSGHLVDQLAEQVFANLAAGDYCLRSASPARDAGIDVSILLVTTDIARLGRPKGAAFDVGAFEYVPGRTSGLWAQQARRGRFGPMGRSAP